MNLIDPSFGEPALLLKRGGWCGFLDKTQGINNINPLLRSFSNYKKSCFPCSGLIRRSYSVIYDPPFFTAFLLPGLIKFPRMREANIRPLK